MKKFKKYSSAMLPLLMMVLFNASLSAQSNNNQGSLGAISTVYKMCDPFPNPFHSTIDIRYEVPETALLLPGPVPLEVEIYNSIGQKVASIQTPPTQYGINTVTWDASGFPAGTYYCRLNHSGMNESKKILLIK